MRGPVREFLVSFTARDDARIAFTAMRDIAIRSVLTRSQDDHVCASRDNAGDPCAKIGDRLLRVHAFHRFKVEKNAQRSTVLSEL